MSPDRNAKPLPLDLPPTERRSRDWRPIIIAALVAFMASLLVNLVALGMVQRSNDSLVRQITADNGKKDYDTFVTSCRAGNLVRGFTQYETGGDADPSDQELAIKLFPIRDCVATYRAGRPVLVPPEIEKKYIEALKRGDPMLINDKGQLVRDEAGTLGVR